MWITNFWLIRYETDQNKIGDIFLDFQNYMCDKILFIDENLLNRNKMNWSNIQFMPVLNIFNHSSSSSSSSAMHNK